MNWTNATTEQLQTIIKYDVDCPVHLLRGVVAELMNRSQLEGMVKKIIMKRFRQIRTAIEVLKMQEEDLFQFVRMKLFEALNRFKPGYSPFSFFAFAHAVGELKDLETKVKAQKRKVYENIQSIDKQTDDGTTFAEFIPDGQNVEKEVIKKITWEEKFSLLTDEEHRAFDLYMKGYSTEEISKMMNFGRSTADRRVNKAISKMCGENVTLKQLGLTNYKKGA